MIAAAITRPGIPGPRSLGHCSARSLGPARAHWQAGPGAPSPGLCQYAGASGITGRRPGHRAALDSTGEPAG
jgi:hypothetical protein